MIVYTANKYRGPLVFETQSKLSSCDADVASLEIELIHTTITYTYRCLKPIYW